MASHKEYRTLPDACSNFTLESFDGVKNSDGTELLFTVIQENPDVTEPWLCENCIIADCPTRKVEFAVDNRFKRPAGN